MKHRVHAILDKVEGPRVLDVGCAGHEANPNRAFWLHGLLCRKFEHVEGIDINRENVEKLRRAGYSDIHCARIEEWQPPHRYNTVVMGEVIEHVGDAVSFLQRAVDLVEEGGSIVLSTPNPFCLMYLAYAIKNGPRTCQNPEHTFWFCESTLAETARRAGLKVAQIEYADDYDADDRDPGYRWFWRIFRIVRPFLPKLMRHTTMVAVLRKA